VWRHRVRTLFLLLASLLVVTGGIVAFVHFIHRRAPEERPGVAALQAFELESFKESFNADASEVRVLAMLSPT